MPRNPADDVPAPSVQDSGTMVSGASCPSDGTLVTISGPRGALVLSGGCPLCKRMVYGRSDLVSQVGVLAAPDEADLEAPKKDDDAEHK